MLEPLRQADQILNSCGRPVPPDGLRWVDLPYWIPFQVQLPALSTQVVRVLNKANDPFLIRSIYAKMPNVAYRLRWPDGRFFNKTIALENPHTTGNLTQQMFALEPERFIAPGGSIQVELSSQITSEGSAQLCTLVFFGVLRKLLRACGAEPPQYVPSLSQAPRVQRFGNILCPEWYLGNQCTPETPDGYEDEPFTLFSNPITVNVNPDSTSTDNVVQVPGDAVFVPRRVRFHTTFSGASTGRATFNVRFADGYSWMGGDQAIVDVLPEWTPVYPTIALAAGAQFYIDAGVLQSAAGPGILTALVEFDGVKRRKLP